MISRRSHRLKVLPLLFAVLLAVPGCSDDDPVDPGGDTDVWVGTWNATSFQAFGDDAIALGMTIEATFTETTYSLTVGNDQLEICGEGGGPSCTTTGELAGTSSTITFDAGGEDEVVFNYSTAGNTMTWTGTIGGTPVTVVWERSS